MQKMSMHEGNARRELLYNAIKNASSLARIFSTKLGLPICCIFVVRTKTTCKYISFWIIFSVSRCSAAVAYLSRCNWYYCPKHKNDLLACFTRILSIEIQTFNTLFVFNVYPRNVFMIDMLTNHVRHLTLYIFLISYTPTFCN